MVAKNAQRHGLFPSLSAFQGPCSGVVYLRAAMKPFLKCLGILPDIMSKPKKPSPFFFSKSRRKIAAKP